MRHLILVCALATAAFGQPISPPPAILRGDPPGGIGAACAGTPRIGYLDSTGTVVSCVSSVWTSVGGAAQTYPGAGIANSTGSAWGTSYGVTGSGAAMLNINPSLGTGASSISRTATAGAGGVAAKYLAAKDATDPTRRVLPASGGCGGGIAATTATVGNTFELYTAAGTVITGVADNAITAGHVLVGGTATPGRVRDSGQTSRTAVDSATCIVGIALAGATIGADVLFEYDGPGTYGTVVSAADVTPLNLGAITYNASGTTTFAAASASIAGGTVTATHSTSTTFSPTGLVAWGSYTAEIIQDSTGGGVTFTLGTGGTCSAWKVLGGGSGAITLSTAANARDVLAFTYDGTNCVASFGANAN